MISTLHVWEADELPVRAGGAAAGWVFQVYRPGMAVGQLVGSLNS